MKLNLKIDKTVESNKWISTGSRLPDIGVDVLCFLLSGKMSILRRQIEEDYIYPYSWVDYEFQNSYDPDEVTHWMPLPEKPK